MYAVKIPFKYLGVFVGQCSEVCGLRHAYMPISVNFVSYIFFVRFIYLHFFSPIDYFIESAQPQVNRNNTVSSIFTSKQSVSVVTELVINPQPFVDNTAKEVRSSEMYWMLGFEAHDLIDRNASYLWWWLFGDSGEVPIFLRPHFRSISRCAAELKIGSQRRFFDF